METAGAPAEDQAKKLEDWVEIIGLSESPYFWERYTNTVRWELPDGAAPAWASVTEPGKDTYYLRWKPGLAAGHGQRASGASAPREAQAEEAVERQPTGHRPASGAAPGWSLVGGWEEHILELVQTEGWRGLGLNCLAHQWAARWPDRKMADYQPVKKLKQAIERYVSGVVVMPAGGIFPCQPLPGGDPLLCEPGALTAAEARATQIEARPQAERQACESAFLAAGWQEWSASYHQVNEALIRCTVDCLLPAETSGASPEVDGAATPTPSPTWTSSWFDAEGPGGRVRHRWRAFAAAEGAAGAVAADGADGGGAAAGSPTSKAARSSWLDAEGPGGQVRHHGRAFATAEGAGGAAADGAAADGGAADGGAAAGPPASEAARWLDAESPGVQVRHRGRAFATAEGAADAAAGGGAADGGGGAAAADPPASEGYGRRCTFAGFGTRPRLAAHSAMEEALRDPRLPPPRR